MYYFRIPRISLSFYYVLPKLYQFLWIIELVTDQIYKTNRDLIIEAKMKTNNAVQGSRSTFPNEKTQGEQLITIQTILSCPTWPHC